MTTPPCIRLPKTVIALAQFDAELPGLAKPLADAQNVGELKAALAAIDVAGRVVAEAFGDDTAEINPRAAALAVRPHEGWFRDHVATYVKEEAARAEEA